MPPTPRDLYARLLSAVGYRLYRWRHPDTPLYTPAAIREIESYLAAAPRRVFEWGSGGSTIWYAQRAQHVIAVEHAAAWQRIVAERLQAAGVAAECPSSPPLAPDSLVGYRWETDWPPYATLSRAPLRPEYRDYLATIDAYPDAAFDLIVIDGKERVGCAPHAIPKLKPGGRLILDDSNRAEYADIFRLLTGWECRRLPLGRRETTLFIKPA